ncbi:MAG: hypothetical protein IGS39_22170 [Calothrix sp. C42_A2020_038]|nr:hypothetical protein [Calothrix sp. C42_A2020_038]
MKCINCGTDNNLNDRTNNYGRCKNCGHPFAFEPTSMGSTKITDPMFAKAISDISVNNTLFFTPKQIFYLLDNRIRGKAFTISSFIFTYIFFNIWALLFFGGILSSFFNISFNYTAVIINLIIQIITIAKLTKNIYSPKFNAASRKASAKALIFVGCFILVVGIYYSIFELSSFLIFVIAVVLGMLSIYMGVSQQNTTNIAQEGIIEELVYKSWLNRWQDINGDIQKLLSVPEERNNKLGSVNPDVTAYSFDRLIVCDSADIAQFLIANNFHFENNCAILSVTGYPQSIFATTMDMLRRNPELKVYALHNCTPKGLGLANYLRTNSNWFQNSNINVIDIGITPRQVITARKNIFIEISSQSASEARQLPGEIRNNMTPQEVQWLEAGNFVNLESFRPQQLIQIIQRSINNSLNLESDSSLLLVGGLDTYIYTVDSFG